MKYLAYLLVCALLAACSTAPLIETPKDLFDDAAFSAPTDRIDADDIFALSDEMRQYLVNDIDHKVYLNGKITALFDELYQNNRLKMSYDARQTRNAAETFRTRAGNCLSLTIMTAAFAKQMGLPTQFHSVANGEIWDRNQNIDFLIGHVNLTVGEGGGTHTLPGHEPGKIIDFAAGVDAHNEWIEDIGEDVIVAMYMNNRAAESLAQNDLTNAYWWARAAILHTPAFLSAYNTLGVIYSRRHDLPQAQQVFQHVLAHEPDNVVAMSNQVQTLGALGRVEESQALARRLAQLQPYPPYFFFNLGLEAMQKGDFQAARNEFTKEVSRASYNHQFHFWLALADYYLGNIKETRKHLTIAMDNSPNRAQHDLYAAKLASMAGTGMH
jgi:Flp pilus assembly protein TadD